MSLEAHCASLQVYVDHDYNTVSAQDICDALNEEAFGARVDHDAATAIRTASAFATSTFSFETNGNEVPTRETLTDLLKTYDKAHVETFVVDVPSKRITICHNPLLLSAQALADDLADKVDIAAKVETDGEEMKIWDFPDIEEGEVVVEEPMTARLRPTVVLSGVFWIISMLSFIGGNW